MAGGEVDREKWARVVRDLLALEAAPLVEGGKPRTHGAKTRFAEKVGLKTPRTVDTWLAQQVDVKEASVRGVAEAYGRNAMSLLVEVKYYREEEIPDRVPTEIIDDEQRAVLDLDIDDESKGWLLHQLEAMRESDEEMIARLRARDRERRDERMRELIAQVRKDS